MKILVTGADGFLGWHTRARLSCLTEHEVVPVGRETWADLPGLAEGADAILHLAAMNKFTPEAEDANAGLAADVAAAVKAAGGSPRIVYSNTIHSRTETSYGRGKALAARTLERVAAEVGGHFVDVVLPNLFGEHGRPNYNSFVATFADSVASGQQPAEVNDREITVMHAQTAAQALIDALSTRQQLMTPPATATTVRGVLDALTRFMDVYATGEIPELRTALDVSLFNEWLDATYNDETVRAHGGTGQTFVSTTHPGITRGEHFHLAKVERFVVVGGEARISLRRLFHDEVLDFHVTGAEPVVIDMPTMWVHNITNTGSTELTTMFWTNTLFDPANPDTYWQPAGDHPALPGADPPRRDPRPCAGPHRPELRLRAQ